MSFCVSEIAGTASEKRPSDESAVKDFVAMTQLNSGTQFNCATFVAMMEPAHLGDHDDPPGFWCLDLA